MTRRRRDEDELAYQRAESVEVRVRSEVEARLARSAAQQGWDPDELAAEILEQYFDEEARFVAAVRRREDALERGEYLTHSKWASTCGPNLGR